MERLSPNVTVSSYQPSGQVQLIPFLPLMFGGVGVALIMAWVLWLTEGNFYYLLITPAIISVPVIGMVALTLRKGRCRNPVVGAIVGLCLLSFYYLGYWMTSYVMNVVRYGPEAVQFVAKDSGVAGPVGYFMYFCSHSHITSVPGDSTRKKKTEPDPVGGYLFYGLELCFIPLMGLYLGRSQARRVYYENHGEWADAVEARYGGSDFEVLMRIVQTGDWPALASLARLPKAGASPYSPLVTLKIEYLPGLRDEPCYVTLTGANLGKLPAAKAAGAKGFGGVGKAFVRQQLVTGASTQQLAELFPGMLDNSKGGKLKRTLEEVGLKTQTVTGPDFRTAAVAASQQRLATGARHLSLADYGISLCLPVRDNPKKAIRSANYYPVKTFGVCFAIAAAGLTILAVNEDDVTKQQKNQALGVVGPVLLTLGGIGAVVSLIGGEAFQRRMLLRHSARQPGSLFTGTVAGKKMVQRLEGAQTFHLNKSAADDIVVTLLDNPRRRLLLEGVSHRYVIQGADVTKLALLDQGAQQAIQITYRVGSAELGLVLVSANLVRGSMSHHPLWAALGKRAARKQLERFRECLGVPASV